MEFSEFDFDEIFEANSKNRLYLSSVENNLSDTAKNNTNSLTVTAAPTTSNRHDNKLSYTTQNTEQELDAIKLKLQNSERLGHLARKQIQNLFSKLEEQKKLLAEFKHKYSIVQSELNLRKNELSKEKATRQDLQKKLEKSQSDISDQLEKWITCPNENLFTQSTFDNSQWQLRADILPDKSVFVLVADGKDSIKKCFYSSKTLKFYALNIIDKKLWSDLS